MNDSSGEEKNVDRSQTISELLRKIDYLCSYRNYFERPRKYTEDDALYMREVHFVIELGAMGTPTMSEMAQRLNVTQGAVTQMAARMEKKGYVTRSKDSMDKRVTILSLTEQGKVLRKNHMEFDKARYEAVSEFLREFSDEELLKLIRYEQLMRTLFTNYE